MTDDRIEDNSQSSEDRRMTNNRQREQEIEELEQTPLFCGNPLKRCTNKPTVWAKWLSRDKMICQVCKDYYTLESSPKYLHQVFCAHCKRFHYEETKEGGLVQTSVCTKDALTGEEMGAYLEEDEE